MKIKFRTFAICMMILALFLRTTVFPGTLTSVLFWGASLVSVICIFKDAGIRKRLRGKKGFVNAACVFLMVSLLSILLHADRTGEELLSQLTASMKIWISYLVNIFFLSLTVSFLHKDSLNKELKTVAAFTVILGAVPVVLGAVQAFFHTLQFPFLFSSTRSLEWAGRYYTLFHNPNGHSQILFILFAMAQYLKLDYVNREKKHWLSVFQILCFVNLCMAASRGTLVAVIGSWIMYDYIMYYSRKRCGEVYGIRPVFILKRAAAMSICAVTLYYSCNYIPNLIPYRIQVMTADAGMPVTVYADNRNDTDGASSERVITRDYYEHGEDISNNRFKFWKYAFATFVEYPVLGVGLYNDLFISCHNGFITVLLAYGAIGFSAFGYMVCAALMLARRNIARIAGEKERKKFAVIAGCMTGIFIVTLTNDTLIFTFEFVNVFAYYFMGYMMKDQTEGMT